ncbi:MULTISPECIES: GntR family transcriptional regulator [unclassified Marinovum]
MFGTDFRAYEEALDLILAKIFLAKPGTKTVLHETTLAREMGLSRTPIRQMLQELALAGLVETRSGVGTVPVELLPSERTMAFKVFQEIATAAANCSESRPIKDAAKIEMAGQTALIQSTRVHDENLYVRYTIKVSHAMADIVDDHILSQAMMAAHWRIIRWRLSDYIASPEESWIALQNHTQMVTVAMMENNAADVLRVAAGISKKLQTTIESDADRTAADRKAG